MRILTIIVLFRLSICEDFSGINLPLAHIPYYFTAFPNVANKCKLDPECPYKKLTEVKKYWGYEYNHVWGQQYSVPECPGDHKGWVRTKLDQQKTFYTQGDFGFIKQQLQELKVLCEPLFPNDSILECSDHLRYCRGRNIMINFTRLVENQEPIRYKTDVLTEGDIGGYCDVNKDEINKHADHISALQSWGPEMRYFTKVNYRPIPEKICDVVVEKPTYIMKIDATVNMYHHFCDFFNLYASFHLNNHQEAFSTDVNILIWETYTYQSLFQDTWDAFTAHALWDLKTFRGKVVCFKNVIFPLLPRMIFGLYYNTPLIYGCRKSGLFHAFSKFILHRLRIPINPRYNSKVKVTLLSRDTKYRRILNEDEILDAINDNKDYEVQKIVYNRSIPFRKQLEITANTDVLVGIHGAGLTHLLFLPDWAAVFEVYNCQDVNCYADLSRLRGLHYVTWKNAETISSQTDGSSGTGMMTSYRESKDLDKVLPHISKCLSVLKSKIVLWYSITNLIFLTSLSLGVLVYGLIHPSKKFWLIYGPIPLASISLIIRVLVCFIYSSKWEQTKLIYETQFSWDIETLPLETQNKILHTWKQTDTDFIVGCVFVACTTIAVLKDVTPVLWDLMSILDFMEEYVPHFRGVIIAGIWINSPYMAFMLIVTMYYVYVPAVFTRIQLIILYSMVGGFKKRTGKQRSDNYIGKVLKSIIKGHQNILRIYGTIKKDTFIPLFLMTVSLFIPFVYNTIVFHSPYYEKVSSIITYFVALIMAAYFSYQGQNLEDQYKDFLNLLYDLNWYEWSFNNMKTFKTLLLNASVPITSSDMALFRINHAYFKESIKVVYTLVNLARTFSHK